MCHCQGECPLTAEFCSLTISLLHPFLAHVAVFAAQLPDAAIAVWPTSPPLVATNAGASYGVTLQGSSGAFKFIAEAGLTPARCLVIVLHWLTCCQRRRWSGRTVVCVHTEKSTEIYITKRDYKA